MLTLLAAQLCHFNEIFRRCCLIMMLVMHYMKAPFTVMLEKKNRLSKQETTQNFHSATIYHLLVLVYVKRTLSLSLLIDALFSLVLSNSIQNNWQ